MQISVHEAKTQLSRLLDLVEDGEEIVIQRHGRPVARLVGVAPAAGFPFRAMQGEFILPEGWDRPLSEEEAAQFWSGAW